jgi:hypothetical protein
MVTRLLSLDAPLERADAYDALAIACCHAHQAGAAMLSTARSGRARVGGSFGARLQPNVTRPAAVVLTRGGAGDVEP